MENRGTFIISLDFELHWGIFDVKTVDEYRENLDGTRNALDSIIELSNEYNIRLTIATVGFLFCENKAEILHFSPKLKPTYNRAVLDPYAILRDIGESEDDDPYHYAFEIVKNISAQDIHEIGTHTFSHYYCNEDGQTPEQFEEDLKAAVKIANARGISIKSIVFPRNQVDERYLEICKKNGLTSFRGNELKGAYSSKFNSPPIIKKGLRLIDSYLNLFGFQTYSIANIERNGKIMDLPSSRFLRPYKPQLKWLENLKLQRIKKSMTHAAKKGELYHLWWHPHNFGTHLTENMKTLEEIYRHYSKLNERYGFKTETMTSFTNSRKQQF